MQVIRSVRQMDRVSRRWARRHARVGLVPTMGALHEGHLSLMRASVAQNEVTIASIFVNPLQFGPHEDFARYPRCLRRDLRAAKSVDVDVVFAPSAARLYPRGFQTFVEPGLLARRWEGASRPGHFRGVATVVTLLFHVTRPTLVYVGQKDYQQALIIQQLARDLRWPMKVRILPTVREPDGLAMSSRNAYLRGVARTQATVLIRALALARDRIRNGERQAAPIIEAMRRLISEVPQARIDYVAIVEANTLEPLWRLRGRIAVLVAVWLGTTRLIDNILVDVP